jgi:hypothetical protein
MVTPDKLNEQGREIILAETDQMREAIISFAHETVKLYLGIDKYRTAENPEGENGYVFFVLAEALHRPENEPNVVLSIRLEPVLEAGEPNMHGDSLTILLPIPADIDFTNDEFDPADLPRPEAVYVIRTRDEASAHYAIGELGTYFYEPSDITASYTDEFDTTEDSFAGFGSNPVKSGLPFLASIYEDMVNMRAVPFYRKVLTILDEETTDQS